jgi:exodeoxyribonuclease V alpha subunit
MARPIQQKKPFWVLKGFRAADDHTPPSDTTAKEINVSLVGSGPRFVSEETGFAIWTAEHQEEHDRAITIKGDGLATHDPGEVLACSGGWEEDPKWGWSFRVRSFRSALPTSGNGVRDWLAARIDGVGPVFAKAIVAHFGAENVFQILDQDPSRLKEVKSAKGRAFSSAQVSKAIANWLEVKEDTRAIREIETFLYEHGVSQGLAGKLYRRYGTEIKDILTNDPFRITEIWGVGFKIADRIARTMGTPLDDPKRVQAGILYLLDQAEQEGHVFVYLAELFANAAEMLEVSDRYLLASQASELARQRRIVVEQDSSEAEQRLYARHLYIQECRLANRIREILTTPGPELFPDPERPTGQPGMSEEEIMELRLPTDEQWEVLELVRRNRLCIVSGSPGVGKTETVLRIVDAALAAGKTIALAAPTGKAARKMREVTNYPASTVHKLLEYSPIDGGFKRDEINPLEFDLLIIDESSMLDVDLADCLFRAVGPRTHVLLVGDPDQLPSVGAGKVLNDLIDAQVDDKPLIPRVHLQRIFRQAAKSMIIRNSRLINQGELPVLRHEDAVARWGDDMESDFYFLGTSTPERATELVLEMVCERIPRVWHLDPSSDIMILAPMHKGPLGLDVLNSVLEKRLNPGLAGRLPVVVSTRRRQVRGKEIDVSIRVGSRIMQTKNAYEEGREVMNGEVAIVKEYNSEKKEVLLVLDDGEREIRVPTVNLETYVLAWASSVHKAQGSEYPCVIYICSTAHYVMLSRALLYTAVTRAKQLCILIGHADKDNPRGAQAAIQDSVRNGEMEKRNTLLAARIANASLAGALF